ncbi:unnamed protein product [Tuber melanosporum]|uniref:(Perigord truffle) hypothetical protein n=1 Tax=Tuber melanosporum (strain Mel28) TaxID=656061 RepID=D5GN63_TUBMM|nr:uncharacterized protein GSTUM_00011105001 [Tuber melanosporum]CAZ85956.1 unnamed protein product [Tuber melanosporum]
MGIPSGKGDHLCVLIHGLWGNPGHLEYLTTAIRQRYDDSKLQILVAKRNSGTFTYDGIELGGERVTREIEDAIEEYARNGVEIRKISIVGYSLGGLVARYAVGLLYSKGYFDRIRPVNFCTFVAPHLGVRTPLLGWHNHIWNVIGARLLSASGRQLFAIDKFRNTGRPLLSILADKDSVFFKGLERFQNRVLYANVVNDRATCYYTAGISRFDPYAALPDISLNYVPGYSPIVLDPDSPISPATREEDEKLPVAHRISRTTHVAMRLPMVLIYTIVIPIGMLVFLLNSLIQTVFSRRRIRLHSSDQLGYHRLPLLVEEMQEAAEGLIEDIHHEMIPQHLTDISEESVGEKLVNAITPRKTVPSQEVAEDSSVLITLVDGTSRPVENASGDSGVPPPKSAPAPQTVTEKLPPLAQGKLEFPTLALSHQQFEMIANIDKLGFRKYPVFIHNDRHSHAAIIVRKPWAKRWDEGRVVVAHWLDKAFIV